MKKLLLAGLCGVFSVGAYAGPPLVSLEGSGGIALNPVAYTPSGAGVGDLFGIDVTKPILGVAYINLGQSNIGWTSVGAATTVGLVEVSYSHEIVTTESPLTVNKNNFGVKVPLVYESKYGVEVSAGMIYKDSHGLAQGVKHTGTDAYLVVSKTLSTSLPVVLSGGILSTKGQVNGILGFNSDRKNVGFANADLVIGDFAVGAEFKQGPKYGDWKDANYYNVHLAYFPNSSVTLAVAYVNAGDKDSTNKAGFGHGTYTSVNIAF